MEQTGTAKYGLTPETVPLLEVHSEEILESAKEQEEQSLENLVNGFRQDLINNMIFMMFNTWCQSHAIDENKVQVKAKGNNPVATVFFESWLEKIEKVIQKEIQEINARSQGTRAKYLHAINSYKLTSPEDMQKIYTKAIATIRKMYYDNLEK